MRTAVRCNNNDNKYEHERIMKRAPKWGHSHLSKGPECGDWQVSHSIFISIYYYATKGAHPLQTALQINWVKSLWTQMSTGTDWTVAKLPPCLVNAADISHTQLQQVQQQVVATCCSCSRTHFQCISISLTELHFGLAASAASDIFIFIARSDTR